MTQIERLIEQADKEVALHGEDASEKDTMLAAFGYLVFEMRRWRNGNGNGRLNGRFAPIARNSPWVVVAGMVIERVLG